MSILHRRWVIWKGLQRNVARIARQSPIDNHAPEFTPKWAVAVQLYRAGRSAIRKWPAWMALPVRSPTERRILIVRRGCTDLQPFLLIRLLDADDRLVLPQAFIPAAERYGLMSAIDRWVIETAFHVCAETLGASQTVEFAINLSGDSLNDDDFPKFVLERVHALSVPPDRICFEITETAAIRNLDRAIEFLTDIKRGGSRVALDDFGSGLSSFRY